MDNNQNALVNKGPWTKEEHEKFLKALEKYGNLSSGSELSKMASEIGNGRTVTDVWKHAEKYKTVGQHIINSRIHKTKIRLMRLCCPKICPKRAYIFFP